MLDPYPSAIPAATAAATRARRRNATRATSPAHAASSAPSVASGSSSTASEPCSERRSTKRPPWEAATRRTTGRPCPWRRRPESRAITSAGLSRRDSGREARPESATETRSRSPRRRASTTIEGPPCSIALTIRLSSACESPAALADHDRRPRPPAQLQRAARHRRPGLPAADRVPHQRLQPHRPAHRRGRPAVDLPVEPLQRRRGQLDRALDPGRPGGPRSRGRQRHRLQRAAQLVHRLVQGAAPAPGSQPLRGQHDRHRGGQRPTGGDLGKFRHPSISL